MASLNDCYLTKKKIGTQIIETRDYREEDDGLNKVAENSMSSLEEIDLFLKKKKEK